MAAVRRRRKALRYTWPEEALGCGEHDEEHWKELAGWASGTG
jgi:hypothetical protein